MTVLPASAVPVRVTVLLALLVSLKMTGAAGAVVSICTVPAGLVIAAARLAALPAASVTVAVPRLTAVTARSGVVCPAATV